MNRREFLKVLGIMTAAGALWPEEVIAGLSSGENLASAEKLREAFEFYGGLKTFGLPISRPYEGEFGDYWLQAFQNGVLMLNREGDCRLFPLIPEIQRQMGEGFLTENGIPSCREGYWWRPLCYRWLTNPAIKAAYFTDPRSEKNGPWLPEAFYGSPVSAPQNIRPHIVQSFEGCAWRVGEWCQEVNNGNLAQPLPLGDLARKAGLIPDRKSVV